MGWKIAFCCNQSNPYFAEVLNGIAGTVEETPELELITCKGSSRFPLKALEVLQPDGVIAGPVTGEEFHKYFRGLPAIGISNALKEKCFPSVINDDREVGRVAAHTLIDQGYTRLVVLEFGVNLYVRLRAEGVEEVAKAAGIEMERVNLSMRKANGRETYPEVWAEHQHKLREQVTNYPPGTGFVAIEPRMAGELVGLREENSSFKIPEHFGLVLADEPEANSSITHVSLPCKEIGKKATELLHQLLSKPGLELPDVCKIPPRGLIEGKTLRALVGI